MTVKTGRYVVRRNGVEVDASAEWSLGPAVSSADVAGVEGSVTWHRTEPVSVMETDHTDADYRGDEVTIHWQDADGEVLVFTGTVASTSGESLGEVTSRLTDGTERLTRTLDMRPIAWTLPPHPALAGHGGQERHVGLFGTWFTHQAMTAAGFDPGVPMHWSSVWYQSMCGSVATVPDRHHTFASCGDLRQARRLSDSRYAPSFLQGDTQIVAADVFTFGVTSPPRAGTIEYDAPWQVTVDMGKAEVDPTYGSDGEVLLRDIGTAAGFALGWDATEVWLEGHAADGTRTRLGTYARTGDARYSAVSAASGTELVLYGSTSGEIGRIADGSGNSLPDAWGGLCTVRVTSPGVIGPVAVTRGERHYMYTEPAKGMILRGDMSATSLPGWPYMPGVQAGRVLSDQADAHRGLRAQPIWQWINEEGLLVNADFEVLAARPVVAEFDTDPDTNSLALDLLSWETTSPGLHSGVQVTTKRMVPTIRWKPSLLLAQGSSEGLEDGDEYEVFLHPESGVHWLGVDLRALMAGFPYPTPPYPEGYKHQLNQAVGTWLGGQRLTGEDGDRIGWLQPQDMGWRVDPLGHVSNAVRQMDPETVRITGTVNLPDGMVANTMPDQKSQGLRWDRRDQPFPQLRGYGTLTEVEGSTFARIGSVDDRHAPYVHDAGLWVQSQTGIARIADYLHESLVRPTPVRAARVEATGRVRAGDKILLRERRRDGIVVEEEVVVTPITASTHSSDDSMGVQGVVTARRVWQSDPDAPPVDEEEEWTTPPPVVVPEPPPSYEPPVREDDPPDDSDDPPGTGPVKPSTPGFEYTGLGLLTVTWDGLTATGAAAVDDGYAATEVALGTANPPGEPVGLMWVDANGVTYTFTEPSVDYGAEFFARIRTVDRWGRVSPWSDVAGPVAPVAPVDPGQFEDLRTRLDEAGEWIDQTGAELEQRLVQAEADIADAETNIGNLDTELDQKFTDADQRIENINNNVLPGLSQDVADAVSQAQNALDEAERAYQAAIDAGATGPNKIINPSFEADPDGLGWQLFAYQEVIGNPQARSGTKVLRISPDGGNRSAYQTDGIEATQDRIFSITYYARRAQGSGVIETWPSVEVTFQDSTTTFLSPPVGDPGIVGVASATWHMVTWTVDMPPNAATARFGVVAARNDGHVLHVDDVAVHDITNSYDALVTAQQALAEARSAAEEARQAARDAADAHDLAITADRRVVAANRPPTGLDGIDVPQNGIWWEYGGTPQSLVAVWRWTGTQWVDAPMDRQVIPLIDIGSGTFGDLSGVRLKAHTVAADALAIGGADNLVPDPTLSDPDLRALRGDIIATTADTGWYIPNGWCSALSYSASRRHATFAGDGHGGAGGEWPVEPGTTYRLAAYARGHSTARWRFRVAVTFKDGSTGLQVGSDWMNPDVGGGSTLQTAEWVCPADVVKASLQWTRAEPGTGGATEDPSSMVWLQYPSMRAMVGSVLIENGAVTADEVNAESVAAATSTFIEADIGKLTALEGVVAEAVIPILWNDVVRSRKMTTDMLLVGSGENLIPDPYMADPDLLARRVALSSAGAESTSHGGVPGAVNRIRMTYGGGLKNIFLGTGEDPSGTAGGEIPVQAGMTYNFQVNIGRAGSPQWRWVANVTRTSGAREQVALSAYRDTGGDDRFTWTCPDNITHITPIIQRHPTDDGGTNSILDIGMPKMILDGASLIVDGTIAARHIDAESIAAEVGEFVEITANQIKAGTLSATITLSGRFQTAASGQRAQMDTAGMFSTYDSTRLRARMNNSGLQVWSSTGSTILDARGGSVTMTGSLTTKSGPGRTVIDSNGLRHFNNANVEDFHADGNGIVITGSLSTGTSTNGVSLSPDSSRLNDGVLMFAHPSTTRNAFLALESDVFEGSGSSVLRLYGPSHSAGIAGARVDLGQATTGTQQSWARVVAGDTVSLEAGRQLLLNSATHAWLQASGQMIIKGQSVASLAATNGTLSLSASGGAAHVTSNQHFRVDAGDWYLQYQSDGLFYVEGIHGNTTTGAANVLSGANGLIRRTTSLAEYKIAKEPLTDWEAVKQVQPIRYYDKANTEALAAAIESGDDEAMAQVEHLTQWVGLTAEQVQETGVGLETYDADGSLSGVAYERLAVALLPWLHELETRITNLEENP